MKLRQWTSTLSIFAFALLAILSQGLAGASAIQVNGDCYVNDCTTIGLNNSAVTYGGSVAFTQFSFNITQSNLDQFNIAGSYSARYNLAGTFFQASASVTYLGNSGGNIPSHFDILVIDALQTFYDPNPGSYDGLYTETVPGAITGPVGAGTSVTTNVFYNGQGVGSLGPFTGVGSFYGQTAATLTGLTPNYLASDYRFTFNIAAGSAVGSGANVSNFVPFAVPEPSYAALLVPVLAIVYFGKRKNVNGEIYGARN